MKFEDKLTAIKLRKKGKSYSEILPVVKVARGTLSKWLKNIPLAERQRTLLKGRMKSRHAGAKANQAKAEKRKEEIGRSAEAELPSYIKNPLFVAGLMLYWAEGTKNGTTVVFTNSDPEAIKLMMRWFREICRVPESKFRILIFIHSLLVKSDWKEKWVKITGVPSTQFIRPYIKPTTTKHRKNKLYYGTCAIRINDSAIMSRIQGWQTGFLRILNQCQI